MHENLINYTMILYGVFSGTYFPAFGLEKTFRVIHSRSDIVKKPSLKFPWWRKNIVKL